MFSRFALMEVWPTITHAKTQADTAGRLVSCATKVMIICLAVFWNGQLFAETNEGLSKEYSDCVKDKAENGTTADMLECDADELDRQDARLNDTYKNLMSKLSLIGRRRCLKRNGLG